MTAADKGRKSRLCAGGIGVSGFLVQEAFNFDCVDKSIQVSDHRLTSCSHIIMDSAHCLFTSIQLYFTKGMKDVSNTFQTLPTFYLDIDYTFRN